MACYTQINPISVSNHKSFQTKTYRLGLKFHNHSPVNLVACYCANWSGVLALLNCVISVWL